MQLNMKQFFEIEFEKNFGQEKNTASGCYKM